MDRIQDYQDLRRSRAYVVLACLTSVALLMMGAAAVDDLSTVQVLRQGVITGDAVRAFAALVIVTAAAAPLVALRSLRIATALVVIPGGAMLAGCNAWLLSSVVSALAVATIGLARSAVGAWTLTLVACVLPLSLLWQTTLTVTSSTTIFLSSDDRHAPMVVVVVWLAAIALTLGGAHVLRLVVGRSAARRPSEPAETKEADRVQPPARPAPAALRRSDPLVDRLSPREREVFQQLVRGRSNAEIAEHLVIGVETVKSHVAEVLRKLELRDRTQAVVFAYERGLVRSGD